MSLTGEQIAKILSTKGQFRSLSYARPMKLRKEFDKIAIKRVEKLSVRLGVDYENLSIIHAKRLAGEKSVGLPWGEWVQFPYLLAHKGKKYYRFTANHKGGIPPIISYIYDGIQVVEADMRVMALASEFRDAEPLVFNVMEENILKLV